MCVYVLVSHILRGVISFLGDISFVVVWVPVGAVLALLWAFPGDMSFLLSVEAGTSGHEVLSFVEAHGVDVHGIWVTSGSVVIVAVGVSEAALRVRSFFSD